MALVDNYTEEEFKEKYYKASSMANLCALLGYTGKTGSNYKQIRRKLEEYNLEENFKNNHQFKGRIKRNPENIFIENSTADQKTLRKYYLIGKYTLYKCSLCGQEPFWNGQEMSLVLDHINGRNHDDRLENLRWVCPNCNSQLPTTGIRNVKFQKELKN